MSEWATDEGSGPARWVGAGARVDVAGRLLVDVLAYVGSDIPAVHDTGGDEEPSVIDPSLPVAAPESASVGVWALEPSGEGTVRGPAYADLTPAQRAWYLDWLAHPTNEATTVPEWAVRLHLSGIERWLYIDSRHRPDSTQLDAIVRRLVDLISAMTPGALLDAVVTALVTAVGSASTSGASGSEVVVPEFHAEWERSRPGATGVFLAWYARAGQTVPLGSLLAMARAVTREALPAEADVCPVEFDRLLTVRVESVPRSTPDRGAVGSASLPVLAASSSFRLPITVSLPAIPSDVVPAFLTDVTSQARTVGADLARFARWVDPGHADVVDHEIARRILLPPELGGHDPTAVPALVELLDERCRVDGVGEVDSSELSAIWPFPVDLATDHAAYHDVLVHLDDAGFALVPDPRVGDPHAGGRLTVYRESEGGSPEPDDLFRLEALRMAWRIIVSDGLVTEAEVWRLEDRLEVEGRTPNAATRRVFHTHRWHRVRSDHGFPPDSGDAFAPVLDPGTAPLPDRHALLRLLVAVAISDGRVGPAQVDALHGAATRLNIDTLAADALLDRMTRQPLVWPGSELAGSSEAEPAIDLTTDPHGPASVEESGTLEGERPPKPMVAALLDNGPTGPTRAPDVLPVIDLTNAVVEADSPAAWSPAHSSILDAVQDLDDDGVPRTELARRTASGLGRRFRGR